MLNDKLIVLEGFKGLPVVPQPENPQEGDWVTDGSAMFQFHEDEPIIEPEAKPVLPMTDVQVIGSDTNLHEPTGIYWVKINTEFTLTADVALPDGDYMVMVEQVVETNRVIDDERFIANVTGGELTVVGAIDSKGNYVVTQERMNLAFDYTNQPVHLSFDKIEINVHY